MTFSLWVIIAFLGVALLFYVLFAGADFGAGILELFVGKKRVGEQRQLVSHAMAPVWEANHVWLILALVILFMAFPRVYALVSTSLHLPLMAILMGIAARGTAFTFRNYDTYTDEYYSLYTKVFCYSSLWTSLFLGITAGAWALGRINPTAFNYYDLYLASWLNPFCMAMGCFTSALFAFLAAVYLMGEASEPSLRAIFRRRAAFSNILVLILGAVVFLAANFMGFPLLQEFFDNRFALSAFLLASLLSIFFWRNLIHRGDIVRERIFAAAIVGLVLLGWFAVQYPAIIRIRADGRDTTLSFVEVAAPTATLHGLIWALVVGSALIFPTLFFLLRIFKRENFRRPS